MALITLTASSSATTQKREADGLNPSPHDIALRVLAEDLLGLRYGPVATFRHGDPSRISNASQKTGLTFVQTANRPPILLGADANPTQEVLSRDIGAVTQSLIQDRFVVTTGFLGNYEPEHARIVIFNEAIEAAAAQLAIPRRSLATITLLHEAVQAITHVGRDLDGRMWPEFAHTFGHVWPVPPEAPRLLSESRLVESSAFHTVIGQYFSYKFLLYLGDSGLLDAFGKLADYQPPPYQEWRRMKDIPVEDMRGWLMRVRRGETGALRSPP